MVLTAALLFGCQSERSKHSALHVSKLPSLAERQKELQEAAARAEAAHDYRPYPVGWPGGTLPLHGDPSVVRSIFLGQTMSQVIQVMGKEGWSIGEPRAEYAERMRSTYLRPRSSFKLPEDCEKVIERLPESGHFVSWRYQGFPSTADWVVVFFAPSEAGSAGNLRVVSRGVFRLGDWP